MWTQWVWLRRLAVTKKEIEAKEKIKLILSGIFARGDINKEEDIISTNKRLDKYWNRNEFFFINNSNIDWTCWNKSKLHLNRKVAYYIANNFRKHAFNIESDIYNRGSSIKDVRTNLRIFGTPLPLSRGAHIWLTTPPPPPPVRADTRLALFETLQLANNSHWRVKKPDHSDTGCTHMSVSIRQFR